MAARLKAYVPEPGFEVVALHDATAVFAAVCPMGFVWRLWDGHVSAY